jgi:hypothetical protein
MFDFLKRIFPGRGLPFMFGFLGCLLSARGLPLMFDCLSSLTYKRRAIEFDEGHLPEIDDTMEHTGYGYHSRLYRCIPITLESVLRHESVREAILAHLSNADRTSIRACASNLKFIGLVSPLVDLITRYIPVQNSLLANLDIIDIIALSRTTKAFAKLYQSSLKMQFNINRNLEQYFTSPKAFRNMQAKCDASVAWTFVEDFFTRTNPVHDEGHMEIMVERGLPTTDMLSFLLADGWNRIMSFDESESLDIEEDMAGLVSQNIPPPHIQRADFMTLSRSLFGRSVKTASERSKTTQPTRSLSSESLPGSPTHSTCYLPGFLTRTILHS